MSQQHDVTRRKDCSTDSRKCDACSTSLAKGTRGNFCRKCYTNPANKNDNSISAETAHTNNNDSSQTGPTVNINLENSIDHLKVRDLIDIIRREIAPILETVNNIDIRLKQIETKLVQVEEANAENTRKVNMMGNDIESLKRVILEQQKYLESAKKKEVSSNIIISGIPNAALTINGVEVTDNNEKLEKIFNHIGCIDKLSENSKITPLPVREGYVNHSIKMQFKSNDDVKHIISNAKCLKTFSAAKIYINYDEPYYSRRENNRLRKKKSELIRNHTNDEIKIYKGKLYHNNMVVDQFDLSNQLF